MRNSINDTIARLNRVIGEAQEIVATAQNGELQRRMTITDKQGFYLQFAESLNLLLQTVASSFNEVSTVMAQVSRGDLTQQVKGDYRGEFASLQDHINTSLHQLALTLTEVGRLANTVADTSAQIAGGNHDMSQRTEQQASAVQETNSNLQSLSEDIVRNAHDTEQAQTLITRAARQAQIGGDTMQNTMGSMTAIRAASHQISDISSVIDGIAFQTNLLALNAAVEAARAGEHGRGFAVVAQEVRQLATRSAGAAKEIKQLLQNAEKKVDDGMVQAEQMEATLQEIVLAVQQTSQLVQRINGSSKTEALSIREIASALKQIETTTEQNASLAEQTAAASVNLQESAVSLGERMQAFRLP
jgi:methyl-accepting chemotaxis protein